MNIYEAGVSTLPRIAITAHVLSFAAEIGAGCFGFFSDTETARTLHVAAIGISKTAIAFSAADLGLISIFSMIPDSRILVDNKYTSLKDKVRICSLMCTAMGAAMFGTERIQ